jgi:hypothetical protein
LLKTFLLLETLELTTFTSNSNNSNKFSTERALVSVLIFQLLSVTEKLFLSLLLNLTVNPFNLSSTGLSISKVTTSCIINISLLEIFNHHVSIAQQ